MRKVCISRDWLLNGTQPVDLPHDHVIRTPRDPQMYLGEAVGYYPTSIGKYTKYLSLVNTPQHYILDIDGSYMCTAVTLNENQLALHPYGYTPFLVDLTDTVRPGHTNKLELLTNPIQPSSRWYTGGGVYRDVFLWIGGELRLEPWDTFVTTSLEGDKAVVHVAYDVSADREADVMLCAVILDGNNKETASANVRVSLSSGKTHVEMDIPVEKPQLWEPETPNLYTLRTEIRENGEIADSSYTTFGIRTVSVDIQNGLLLNGKPLKLRGGCIHHDNGVLGAAAFPAAEERKVRLLKEAGFNALRTAHNPPSLALLEACDRMGLLVMDEAFDMWAMEKHANDYHLWFPDWWDRDISYMVRRDRNHPCVISYSIGNEVYERSGKSDGVNWAKKLAAEVRRWDNTRMITAGMCGIWDSPAESDPPDYVKDFMGGFDDIGMGELGSSFPDRTEAVMETLDMVGYNYLYFRYEVDHERYPNRIIWGSETHALTFYDSWQATLRNNYVIGDFTWTAIDSMGEVGTGRSMWARDGVIPGLSLAKYPWRSCYQGDHDLCGYRRPQSYFRQAVFVGGTEPRIFTTHPTHNGEGYTGTDWHWYDVIDTWNFEDGYLGQPVQCDVYTDADEIEWYINGRCLGRTQPVKAIATMMIPYERGEVSVIAYKNGLETGRSSLHTVGNAAKIAVTPEKTVIDADNRDLCYLHVTVTDENGARIPNARLGLCCEVTGGELLGFYSGDPTVEDQYGSNTCHTFYGRALAIVRAKNPGKITVTVSGSGLGSGSAEAEAVIR